MRAVILNAFGDPATSVVVGEAREPEAGPGELLLRLVKSPIHNHDLSIIRGTYGYKPPLPAVMGSEGLGVVEALGEGVAGFAVGQKVAVPGGTGVWAEYFKTPATAAVPVPPGLSDDIACQLLAMPFNGYVLFEALGVSAGDWIVQTAANGAVGRVVIQLAKARGVNVISLVRDKARIAEVEALGAEHVLSTDDEAWPAAAAKIAAGAPIKAAIDSVSGAVTLPLASLLAPGGLFLAFGAMSQKPIVLDPGKLIFGKITVKGFWGTAWFEEASQADKVRVVGDLVRLALDGTIKLGVEVKYDLADIGEALARSDKPGRAGKVLLTSAR